MAITVRDQWPVVFFDMVSPTDEDHDRYHKELEQRLWRGQPFAVIFNTLGSTGTTTNEARDAQVTFMRTHVRELQANLKGFALVIANPAVRAIVTAVMWKQPLPVPHAIFKTEREAVAWSLRQLRDAGLTPPPIGNFI